jgi:superfamily II DNA/RNA helicase
MEPEQAERVLAETQSLISERRFRNFVAQAHSRAVLQHLEADPNEWPRYSPVLDENLLYTAHLLFWQGLQLRALPAFRVQGDGLVTQGSEIIEFLYSEAGSEDVEKTEQLFSAALGYYIAGHYARAYVLMKDIENGDALPSELELLRRLFLKNLAGLRNQIFQLWNNERYSDSAIVAALRTEEITEDEGLDRVLRASLHRAFSFFLEYPKNGYRPHIERALEILEEGIMLAGKMRFVYWWWLFYCARHLIDEFDMHSLWTQLKPLRDDDANGLLVEPYIRASYRHDPPIVELWRSQTRALPEVNDAERSSYCLKMPTSAGKTRVAELAILRFLIDHRDEPKTQCVYVAPFRSLAVELESGLRQSFHPLGIRVSELYGGFELSPVDRLLMEQTRIIVATPEKVDAFLRYNPEFADQIRLIVIDEGHIISPTERGVRFEFFLHRLITRFTNQNVRFFFLSAVLPNIDQFAAWITGDSKNVIESDWRPSRIMLGELRWNGHRARIDYTHSGYHPLEHDCFVSSFIQPLRGQQLRGTHRRNPFPHSMREAVADATLSFSQQDMTLVFVAQKRSVEPFGRELLEALRIRNIVAKREGSKFVLPISPEGRELMDECIALAEETMGADAEIIQFLQNGFVVHHGGLPQKLRIKIEQLVRRQVVRLVVATTTLAQGVNFPIRTVIVHSLQHGYGQPLSPLDFWNICGRAGRGMTENEGQVLFAVDQTLSRRRRTSEAKLREDIIQGFQKHRLASALRQLLSYVVRQWKETHPVVNVAELCQRLAENNLEWALSERRETLAEWLDFLDAQLIALTEEQEAEDITPDDLQNLLRRSLLILQLESEPGDTLTAELASDLLYARLQSIRRRFPSRYQRHRFYQLGFPLSDCQRVAESSDDLFRMFLAAQAYYQWDVDTRCDFTTSILEPLFNLRELKPQESSLSRKLVKEWQKLAEQRQLEEWQQLEEWRQLWKLVLKLWLKGQTPNEMVEEPEVAKLMSSPAEVSVLIDDLFGYRAPWGLNALSIFLRETASESGQELPAVTSYFSALVRYGVHSPAACILLAFGLESRKLALKLVESSPSETMDPRDLLVWFVGLTREQLTRLGFYQDEVAEVIEAQQETLRINQMGPRRRTDWSISVDISDGLIGNLQEGDTIVLQVHPQNSSFSLYSLWGDMLGIFEVSSRIPPAWSSPDQIEVTVVRIRKRDDVVSLDLLIAEV